MPLLPQPALPLRGVRVVDLSQELGAYCTKLLADAGADVVKVEPSGGDVLRRRGPFPGDIPGQEASLSFAYYHSGQRSVQIDLSTPGAQQDLAGLAEYCDVIVLSPAPGAEVPGFDRVTGRLGWAPDAAIVCAITPFGLTGPYRDMRSTEFVAQAVGGVMYGCGSVSGPPVAMPGQQLADLTGTHAAIAILHALGHRAQHGGQLLDISVHDVAAASSVDLYVYTSHTEIMRRRGPFLGAWGGTFEAVDGPVEFTFATDKHWRGLLDLLGHPEALADPALFDQSVRAKHADEIVAAIQGLVEGTQRSTLVDLAQRRAVPATPINTVGEFADHPHTRARGFIVTHRREPHGELRMPRSPFVAEPAITESFRTAAPLLGSSDATVVRRDWARAATSRPAADAELRPLSQVRIISFGTNIAGALCASYLAELGADVVKIESPLVPDNSRRTRRPWERAVREPSGIDTSAMYQDYNRSVRSVALDLKDPARFELLMRLIPQADVIIENYSPGVIDRWGLTLDRIRSANPRLVMVSLSGFGQSGPCRDYLLYGATTCSFSGLARTWGLVHQAHYDYVSAAHGVFAVLSALRSRDRTGAGVRVDLAQVEAAGSLMAPFLVDYLANGRDVTEPLATPPWSVLAEVVPCAGEDRWVAVDVETTADWRRLAGYLGEPEAPAGGPGPDREAIERVRAALRAWASDLTPHQAMLRLQRAGLAAGAVHNGEDLAGDTQLRHRHGLAAVTSPDLGTSEWAVAPYRLSKTPATIKGPAPRLGEHTAEVLAEWLDISYADAASYATAGAQGPGGP